jgi:hypothetical protein
MSYSKEYIAEVKAAFDASYADYKKDEMENASEFHKLTFQEQKDALRNATKPPKPSDYEKNRAAYVEYLLMCVRLGDWHGVSDAANDLRVLEAKK